MPPELLRVVMTIVAYKADYDNCLCVILSVVIVLNFCNKRHV
jgi:hypothetical protein